MAVTARQMRIVAGRDHVVAVQRELVIDPELGIAAEVEKTTVAVDLGGGNIAVQERQRVVGVVLRPKAVAAPKQVRL